MASDYGRGLLTATLRTTTQWAQDTLVAAQSGKRIRVAAVFLSAAAVAQTFTVWSGTVGGARLFEAYMPITLPIYLCAPPGEFLFETAVGAPLTVDSSAAGGAFCLVKYDVVP